MGTEFRATERALEYLLSPQGKTLLEDLATREVTEATLLGHIARLRKTHPPEIAAAALDLTLLRQKARAKFERANEMFFTGESLEQASAEVVARYRAHRFSPYPAVADLCCGIGGDALALAAHASVLAVDREPLRLRMALANARAYGVQDRLRTACADVTGFALDPGMPIWADPSRRRDGQRVYSVEAYQPPLSALLRLARHAPGAGVKLSPGVSYSELDALVGSAPHEIEIVSVHREAREAVLWLGELCTATRRATLLPSGHTLIDLPLAGPVETAGPGRYLYEPDPAVIRSHLVEHLAELLGATKLDEQIAYLTADALVDTPFARAYAVDEAMPFNLKRLNARLRTLDIGQLIVKKRGFPVDPEQFRRKLKYGGGQRTVALVLTHVLGRPSALICRPLPEGGPSDHLG